LKKLALRIKDLNIKAPKLNAGIIMNKKITLIIAVQTALIILLFWVLVHYAKDEYHAFNEAQEEEVATPNRVNAQKGSTVVTLSTAVQAQSDIKTTKLNSSEHQNTLNALGTVINIDTLIELRTRYLNAKANANIARAALTSSQQEYKRMQQLNQDNKNVSDQVVLNAQTVYKSDQAKLDAAETEAKNLRDTIRQNWGDALASNATNETNSAEFQKLLSHQNVLILISFPLDASTHKANKSINIYPTGSSVNLIKATLFSESPLANQTIQGVTYYYTAPESKLRAGMRLTVQMDDSNNTKGTSNKESGLLIPSTAVVWYGGKAWVYKKQDKENFVRLPINTEHPSKDGWFNQASVIQANDEIVTSGAQLLLSEEFKYQIKNENED